MNTRVGVLGDVHADYGWMAFALWKMNLEGINKVLQVGDMGIGRTNYNAKFLDRTSKLAVRHGVTLYVVPGNHEDWDQINGLVGDNRTEWAELRPNIMVAPRGMRWTWGSSSFVALGGAPSVDRGWRQEHDEGVLDTKYHSWFPGEMITQEDVEYVVAGGYADVMVGHDAPQNVTQIDGRIAHNPLGFRAADLVYAADGRFLYNEAFRGVNPLVILHGHYHFKVDEMIRNAAGEFTNVMGYHCNGNNFSMGHYDTEEKKAYHWDILGDVKKYNASGYNMAKSTVPGKDE